MKLQLRVLILAVFLLPSPLLADAFLMPGAVAKSELVKAFPQPYIVKKGDTLWDIAQEYFANPHKWLKIWEHNLYVSNPDLIYPGNEIWLKYKKPRKQAKVKVRKVAKLEPKIIYKPAERLEKVIDTSSLVKTLARQDFIDSASVEGVGHILDSEDERLNYGANDKVYLALDVRAHPGDTFNIFRTGDPIYKYDEEGNKLLVGYLVNHLGTVEVTSEEKGVFRGVITQAFEEIGRTDRLKRALPENYSIEINYPDQALNGHVTYIRGGSVEAGQGQVVGIDLGADQGLREGTVLGIYRSGQTIRDKVYKEETYRTLPDERIGEIVVLKAQDEASIALVSTSSEPINIKDIVRSSSRR